MAYSLRVRLFELGLRVTQAEKAYVLPLGHYESEFPVEFQVGYLLKLQSAVDNFKNENAIADNYKQIKAAITQAKRHARNIDPENISNRNASFANILQLINSLLRNLHCESTTMAWYEFGLALADSYGQQPTRSTHIPGIMVQDEDSTPFQITPNIPFGKNRPGEWCFNQRDTVETLINQLGYEYSTDYVARLESIANEWDNYPGLPEQLWGWICLDKDMETMKSLDVDLRFNYSDPKRATVTFNGKMFPVTHKEAKFLETIFNRNGNWITGREIKKVNGWPEEDRMDRLKEKLPLELQNLIDSDSMGYRYVRQRS